MHSDGTLSNQMAMSTYRPRAFFMSADWS